MPQRKQVTWSDLRVGLLVLAGLFLIAVTIFYVTGAGGALAPKYKLVTYLPEVSGLTIGAPVRLDGVEIGNVETIRMTPRAPDGSLDRRKSVQVQMRIDRRYETEIRTDSTAALVTEGLLGNRYVNIVRGITGSQIPPGGEVKGQEEVAIKQIVERGADLVQNLDAVSVRVRAIVDAIDRGQGNLGKFIRDEQFYNRLNGTVSRAEQIVASVQAGQGTIGKLVATDELYNRFHSATTRVDTLLADVQGQKGTLGKIIYDPSVYEQAKQLVERGNKMAADVEAGKGTLGKLVTDDALYTNVRNAASNVEQATAKLNANTGTAGRIFNDPAFYDNVTGLAGDMRLLVGEFRKDPKKFLRVKFSIF